MTLIERRDGGASMLWRAALRVGAPDRKGLFSASGLGVNRRLATLRSPPDAQCAPTRAKLRTRGRRRSVWRPVLVRHPPLAVDRHHGEVVVGVVHRIARGPVADFEVDNVRAGFVDEAMAVAASGLEAGAHAG
jgi:hypothetical protein